MKHLEKKKQKGFTLVELSIVLVIIGLLIGGILAAQSMISTTKIQAFTRQLGQFDAAVATFKDRYKFLPGDSDKLTTITRTNATKNNGIIEAETTNSIDGEQAIFWAELGTTGLKNEKGATFDATWSSGPTNTNSPKAKAGKNTFVVPLGSANGNFYAVGAPDAMTGAAFKMKEGFDAQDALAIDMKSDDGSATAGNVRGVVGAITTSAAFTTPAGTAYDVDSSPTATALGIRMGSSSGDLY
jgi:prepilin-type N-terminal cleavage/methylation domain-containing protein